MNKHHPHLPRSSSPWPVPPQKKKGHWQKSASHKKSSSIPRLFVHILQAKFQMSVNCLWQIWGVTFCASNQWPAMTHNIPTPLTHLPTCFLIFKMHHKQGWGKHWLCFPTSGICKFRNIPSKPRAITSFGASIFAGGTVSGGLDGVVACERCQQQSSITQLPAGQANGLHYALITSVITTGHHPCEIWF